MSAAASKISPIRPEVWAPDLPWNTYKAEDLGPRIMGYVEDHEPFFRWWAQVWYENFQFLFGNHSLKWSRKHGFAVDVDFMRQGQNSTFQRAWTNLARPVVEGLTSLIYSSLPEWEVEASEESSIKGKRFQRICSKLLDCLTRRMCMDQEFATAAFHFVMFGQFAWRLDWNFGGGQMLEIPRYKKTKAPAFSTYMAPNPFTGGLLEVPTPLTDQGGAPVMEERWEAMVDELGRQVIDKVFAGTPFCRTLSPLEYRREMGSAGPHKSRIWQEFRLIDYDQFVDEYKDLPGATQAFKRVKPIGVNASVHQFAIRHFMRMQYTTPPSVEDGFRRAGNVLKSSLFKYKVLVVEHWDAPHRDKWSTGRHVVVCNGEATHVTRPTYEVEGVQDGWHPYVEAQWMKANPSSIAPGPMNDVVRKNRELNVKDGLIATSVRRNMGSQLLIKTGSGIKPEELTGEPGMAHEVSDPFGARYLHDDLPIPPVIHQLRQQDKDDVYETSGAGDALRGQPATGASSGYQEKQREEREEKRLAPARRAFEQAVSGLGEKSYACLKANVIKLDDLTMGYLKRSAAGEFTEQDIIAFLTTSVSFGTEIKVKKSSMALKSKATQQATLMELAAGPLGPRLAQDAKVLDKFLKFFDAETLRDASAVHRDRAERENQCFEDMLRLGPDTEGIPSPKVMFGDDDDIHLAEHGEWEAKNAELLMSNEYMLLRFLEHTEYHRLQKQEKGAELMPGTALQTGNMMQAARQVAQPTVQTIYNKSMMDQQAKVQQPPQQGPPGAGPTGQRQAPQAPSTPAPPGGGAPRTNPAAPSGATPQAKMGGALR